MFGGEGDFLLQLVQLVLEGNITVVNIDLFSLLVHNDNCIAALMPIGLIILLILPTAATVGRLGCVLGFLAVAIGHGRLWLHEGGKLRHVAGSVDVLQGARHLRQLLLLVVFKHLQLVVHLLHQLLLLVVKDVPVFICDFKLFGMDIIGSLSVFDNLGRLVSPQVQSRDVRLEVTYGQLCLLLVEVSLVVSLNLLQEGLFTDSLRQAVDVDSHVDGEGCQTLLGRLLMPHLVPPLIQVEHSLSLLEDHGHAPYLVGLFLRVHFSLQVRQGVSKHCKLLILHLKHFFARLVVVFETLDDLKSFVNLHLDCSDFLLVGPNLLLDWLLPRGLPLYEHWEEFLFRLSPGSLGLPKFCLHLIAKELLLQCDHMFVLLSKELTDAGAIRHSENRGLVKGKVLTQRVHQP